MKQASPGDIVLVQGALLIHPRKNHEGQLTFDAHLTASKIIR